MMMESKLASILLFASIAMLTLQFAYEVRYEIRARFRAKLRACNRRIRAKLLQSRNIVNSN